MEEWKDCSLGDIITFQRGHDLPMTNVVHGEFPIAGSNGIIGYHDKYTTKAPSITIGRSGTIGNPKYYDKDFWAHNTTLYVKEFKGVDPKYIYYLFKTIDFTIHNSGSAVPTLNRNYLHPIEVKIPPLYKQLQIAKILGAIDDKIDLNLQMNNNLELMAQSQFKHDFVDGIDPDNLPKGWKHTYIGDCINTISKTHKFPKSNVIFLNTSDILDGFVLHSNYSEIESLPGQAKKSIQKFDILYSEIRPMNKRFAYVNFNADDYVVSTKLMVLRPKTDIDSIFFYFILTRPWIISELQNQAEARSGTFPQITFDQIKEISFLLPDRKFLNDFIEKVLVPNYQLIYSNSDEIKYLTSLRDYLLPKLISGELIPSDLTAIEQSL